MPTRRTFNTKVSYKEITHITNSIGAHIGSKLQEFGTDERTFTDELCDMLCIWSNLIVNTKQTTSPDDPFIDSLPSSEFNLELHKTTPSREVLIGSDLEIIIRSPFGFKKALFQAKVLDPDTGSFRIVGNTQWEKLRQQLSDMRQENGDLSFLLIYVPGGLLDGTGHLFQTWEQGFLSKSTSGTNSRFGSTVIPVNHLLDDNDDWLNNPSVDVLTNGRFQPRGFSFTRILLELFSCSRGAWISFNNDYSTSDNDGPPFCSLSMSTEENSMESWDEMNGYMRLILEETDFD